MSTDSFDRELRRELRETTETASPGFTTSVLDRVAQRRQRSFITSKPVLAAAAAMTLFALGTTLGLRLHNDPPEVSPDRQRLVREYMELQQELQRIQQLANDASPVLYLGGDDTLDVLFDLRNYDAFIDSDNMRPASLATDGR